MTDTEYERQQHRWALYHILSIPILMLTGCATMDQIVCTGTGTCSATGSYAGPSAKWVSPIPQSVITPQGTLIITRDQSTGAISHIIPVSRAK